jgi:hypothetical protein
MEYFQSQLVRVIIEKYHNQKVLTLHDSDPFDYAKLNACFLSPKNISAEFS